MTTYHIYCDESCHLEHDWHKAMVLGAIRCPKETRRDVAIGLRDIKVRHGLNPRFELKWTKVSSGNLAYYTDVIDYFFDRGDLAFRAVVVPDKSQLRHEEFGQTHDDFYYKIYFQLIRHWLDRGHDFRVFLDIKDTRSSRKTQKLREVLGNSQYDFEGSIVRTIEIVRSDQIEQVQLADLLIGCVSYANRGLTTSAAKLELVRYLRQRAALSLTRTTLTSEPKVNIFVWRAQQVCR